VKRSRALAGLIAALALESRGQTPTNPAPTATPDGKIPAMTANPSSGAKLEPAKPAAAVKPLLAVMPFEARQVAPEEAQILAEAIASEIARSGEIRLMERGQMDKILAEQGFQKSGSCSGTECAVEVGQILGIDRMIVGSVGHIGKTYVLSARMVNIATGEVLRSASQQAQGEIDQILTTLVPKVAMDLLGKLAEAKPANASPTAQFSSPPPPEIWTDSVMVVWQASDDKSLAAVHLTLARNDRPDSIIVKDMRPVRGTLANGSTLLRFPAKMDSGTYLLKVTAEDNEKAVGSSQVYLQRKIKIKESGSSWGWWLFGTLLVGGGAGAAWYLTQQAENTDGDGTKTDRSFVVNW
jgi:TolB-like protein